ERAGKVCLCKRFAQDDNVVFSILCQQDDRLVGFNPHGVSLKERAVNKCVVMEPSRYFKTLGAHDRWPVEPKPEAFDIPCQLRPFLVTGGFDDKSVGPQLIGALNIL